MSYTFYELTSNEYFKCLIVFFTFQLAWTVRFFLQIMIWPDKEIAWKDVDIAMIFCNVIVHCLPEWHSVTQCDRVLDWPVMCDVVTGGGRERERSYLLDCLSLTEAGADKTRAHPSVSQLCPACSPAPRSPPTSLLLLLPHWLDTALCSQWLLPSVVLSNWIKLLEILAQNRVGEIKSLLVVADDNRMIITNRFRQVCNRVKAV